MTEAARSGKKILLADDNPKNVRLLEMTLKQEGHELLVATDGEEALKRFIRDKPDLVILDALMPRMDGLEVCRKMREHAPEKRVPVILSSAFYQGEAYEREKEDLGIDALLPKPVRPADLLEKVRELLARPAGEEG